MYAKIVDKNGVKAVEVNGEVFEYVGYRTWRPSEQNIEHVSKSELPFFALLCSGIVNKLKTPYSIYGEYWQGDGVYDWDVLRRDLDLYIKHAPNSYLAINLMLDTREWFLKAHPECPNSFENISTACAYPEWRECASRMLRDTLDFFDREYPDKVFAIILSAGGTCEWHNKDASFPVSEPREKMLREWTGDPKSHTPTREEYVALSDGIFRNAVKEKNTLDFLEFYHGVITRELAYYARLVKEHTDGRILVGAPVGYIMAGDEGAHSGHCAAADMLKIPDLDIIVTPASYWHRALDNVSASQTGLDAVRLNGKLMIHSIDNRTYAGRTHPVAQLVSLHALHDSMEESISYIRRESAMAMSKGAGFWFFDQYGCNYPEQAHTDELGLIRKAFQKVTEKPISYNAEVALLIDSKSYIYTGASRALKNEHVNLQRTELGRMGCPVDHLSIYDLLLDNFPKNQYKLMIVADCFAPSDEIRKAIAELKKNGVCFLFLYAAGAVTDHGFDLRAASDFCGISLKEDTGDRYFTLVDKAYTTVGYDQSYGNASSGVAATGASSSPITPFLVADDAEATVWGRDYLSKKARLAFKRREKGFDVWSSWGTVPYGVLQKIAEEAGVHFYQRHGLPTYANSRMAAFFDHKGGTRKITFPYQGKMTEFYSGEVYVSTGEEMEITFGANECKLFIYEE